MKPIFFLFIILFSPLAAVEDLKEVVFVSLGSHCEVSMKLFAHKLRYFSTPVDWMLTQDHEGLVRLIDERFLRFLDEEYLEMNTQQVYVINTYYNVDFRHDWPEADLSKHLPAIRDKYHRRIERFYNLSDLAKRVVFIRTAYDHHLNVADNMPFDTPDSWTITSDQAARLRDVLRKEFPLTDFILVIINYDHSVCDCPGVFEFVVRKDSKLDDYKNLVDLLNNPDNYDLIKAQLSELITAVP